MDGSTWRSGAAARLHRLANAGLVKEKTVGIDAPTPGTQRGNSRIARRDTGESYQDFVTKLAQVRAARHRRVATSRGSI